MGDQRRHGDEAAALLCNQMRQSVFIDKKGARQIDSQRVLPACERRLGGHAIIIGQHGGIIYYAIKYAQCVNRLLQHGFNCGFVGNVCGQSNAVFIIEQGRFCRFGQGWRFLA